MATGAEDDVAPVRLAKVYVDSIVAPEKRFVAIPGAGHSALNTKSEEFLGLMNRWVRPLAIESLSVEPTR